MELTCMLVGLVLGIALNSICFYIYVRRQKAGKLRIDRSDPSENPYLFLEASMSVGEISRKKYVIFQVSNENFISQN